MLVFLYQVVCCIACFLLFRLGVGVIECVWICLLIRNTLFSVFNQLSGSECRAISETAIEKLRCYEFFVH